MIVHALLEGEQIIDLRKGGLREDGRHFDLPAPAPLAVPDRRAPARGAARSPRTATGSSSRPRHPSASRSPIAGWADVVDVATITEPEQLEAIASKVIWTGDYAASRLKWKQRDPLWVLVLRAHRLDEPITVAWAEGYGGCTSWVTLDGLPADPASLPSHPALSDVAFESKRKGVRDALPAECWQP